MKVTQHEWPTDYDVTVDAVRLLHIPGEHYRISSSFYPAGTSFSGSIRAGRIYVLSGVCSLTFGDACYQLNGPSYIEHPECSYRVAVHGDDGVTLVHVWLLPPDFRPDHPPS